jgi:hypothetical protein
MERRRRRSAFRFAISEGELAHDPTQDIQLVKAPKTMGHMTWKLPQVSQYRERHQLGTVARVALELMLNIAARREDAHKNWKATFLFRLGRSAFKADVQAIKDPALHE